MEDRIVLDPEIQHGKPVIRGTRVPVVRVLAELAAGMSHEEVMVEYDLTREDLLAVFRYTAELMEREKVHPLPATA